MPQVYEECQTPTAGRGLSTTKELKTGSLVYQDKTPFVAVLDSPVLTKACSWCFVFTEESGTDEEVTVSACTGCKIVRYCGKSCQTAAWKHSHKYECKIFKGLYPQVLPNTARMILQILLRRRSNTITQDEWDQFLKLEHHMDDLEKGVKAGNEYSVQTMQNVQLMARAGKEYSGSTENPGYVETLVGRLITNTLTLTSPVFTPLGLMLSLVISVANHSCSPNTAVTYSGRIASLRAVEPLKTGSELTISYINTTMSTEARRNELVNRYHFNCQCDECSRHLTLGHPDIDPDIQPLSTNFARAQLESEVAILLAEAKAGSAVEGLPSIVKAFHIFKQYPNYPPWLSPLHQLRFDLITSLQANRYWVAAFIQSLVLHFKALPKVHSQSAHPARVARGWVHAKMADHIGGLANEPDFATSVGAPVGGEAARALTAKFELDWGLVVYALVKHVSDQVLKSHGIESRFSLEVGKEMGRLKEEAKSSRGEPSNSHLEKAMSQLETIAEEGWEWWKSWMRDDGGGQKMLVSIDGQGQDALSLLLE